MCAWPNSRLIVRMTRPGCCASFLLLSPYIMLGRLQLCKHVLNGVLLVQKQTSQRFLVSQNCYVGASESLNVFTLSEFSLTKEFELFNIQFPKLK